MVRRSEGSKDSGLVGDPVPVDIQSLRRSPAVAQGR